MITSTPQPSAPGPQASAAGQHLAAIATSLSGYGITSRLTRLGGTPVLTVDAPGVGEDLATIAVDPDTHVGPGLRLDCTCTWTAAPGATPQATAATITAVLDALSSAPERT